ncbi:ABC-type sugar transport system, substrate-binding protein, contains N-terminal xre family HTH domain [Quadrisphaera granulorum]|uniref:ABC-type sugar transport system substrate-binding protein n=1 Tax=Quadrisphaera granulorum TaxID=317664 RepID=A0A315ZRW6_9ACTN|nr:substrate-binding domain-containing protein [Quadrisphaera granulorum]PWJ48291.1 ABC-type sugar transport system substrate-binding protein [Quadrisphaera granulorum]SZE98452.1 ABC-type sugar transport system, substrate-binding protein, contains N-terminal xre family HTH domain [Quadrisphaera granulorum]
MSPATMSPAKPRRRLRALAAGSLLLLTLTACSSTTTSSTSASASAGGADTAAAERAAAAVEAGYAGDSTTPPTSGPAPATGKNVWLISASQQVPGLAHLTERGVEAATTLGWQTNVCDGQNNADGGWAKCVRQAVSAGADAVVLEAIDCAPVSQALSEARAKGVLVASLTSFDCDDPTQGGGQKQFDVDVPFSNDRTAAQNYTDQGKLRADWVIAQTKGAAKVVHVEFRGVAFGEYLADAFNEQIATCTGCEVVSTVVITPADIPNIRQKFETALLQAPTANAVAVDVDFMLPAGVAQALSTSGKQLTVAGAECSQESIGYLHRQQAIGMCIGGSSGWLAYAGMDGLNRAFAGQPVVDSGAGIQLVDATHNLPAEGSVFEGSVDYASAYRAAWGV